MSREIFHMSEEQLTLQKARELNQLDKFADQQDAWLAENGYSPKPECETEAALSKLIRSAKSTGRT